MKPTKIVIHTTGFNGDADIKEIERWHKLRGFKTVGYHWYIRRDGTLEKGRPEHVFGAHCKAAGRNRDSIGICFEGHGDFEPWTEQQVKTWQQILYPGIRDKWGIGSKDVHGHNEFDSGKTCPGKLIDMGEVRAWIKAKFETFMPGIDRVVDIEVKKSI